MSARRHLEKSDGEVLICPAGSSFHKTKRCSAPPKYLYQRKSTSAPARPQPICIWLERLNGAFLKGGRVGTI
jgi:hypothetical protein